MSDLAELFPHDHVLVMRTATKVAVLRELSQLAATLSGKPVGPIALALTAREGLGSTGVGAGIAVPHASIGGLDGVVALFARLERSIDWQSIDGRQVDLVCLVLTPEHSHGAHLQTLAKVTRRLRDPVVAAALRAAREQRDVHQLLVGQDHKV